MHLCLIATTRGREIRYIERLFKSLAAQEHRDFSLVLGDQNPPGMLDALLEEYAEAFPVTVVPLEPCGLSAARNRLLPHAKGDWIALTDDDCWYAPDTFARLAESVAALPDASAVIGARGDPNRAAVLDNLSGEAARPERENRHSVMRNAPSWCLFIRLEDAIQNGPFDEDMGIGAPTPWQSGEETDFLVRLLDGEKNVYRDERIRVFHEDSRINADMDKVYSYGMGRMHLLHKHNYSIWFKLVNILFPLARLLPDVIRHGVPAAYADIAMFRGRLAGGAQMRSRGSRGSF